MSTDVETKKNTQAFGQEPGLDEELVHKISESKKEPEWMLNLRVNAFKQFKKFAMPKWGCDLSGLDFDQIRYYIDPNIPKTNSWDDVPADIKKTFDELGLPEAEQRMLAGTHTQVESQVIYENLKGEWEEQGIIFCSCDEALQEHEDLMKKYFSKSIPTNDHKFISLHYAYWSGGTFLYVPKDVQLLEPVQAYFRINSAGAGQFEHTLVVAEPGSESHYIEGCSAPTYQRANLHAGAVEVFVQPNAKFRYSSIENWSKNTYNMNTKRAIVQQNATMEWVTGNMGSCASMVYPASMLVGNGARAEHLGIAYAKHGQHQDNGAKIYHMAPNTTSYIQSKSLSREDGIAAYRGIVFVGPKADNASAFIQCDSLMVHKESASKTIPIVINHNKSAEINHEARAFRVSDEKLFYLQSRGLDEQQAVRLIVNGFVSPFVKELPMEYAVELNNLINMDMDGF